MARLGGPTERPPARCDTPELGTYRLAGRPPRAELALRLTAWGLTRHARDRPSGPHLPDPCALLLVRWPAADDGARSASARDPPRHQVASELLRVRPDSRLPSQALAHDRMIWKPDTTATNALTAQIFGDMRTYKRLAPTEVLTPRS